jgi:GT2 family glycosyltransferase
MNADMGESASVNTDPVSLAIVIPTCNRPDLLKQCLVALQSSIDSAAAEGIETDVVVTDDGSQQSAVDVVRSFPYARWTEGPREGPSANRNAGVQSAAGSWIIFLDDDVIPTPNLLASYIRRITTESYDVLEGRVMADRPRRAFNEASPINLTGGALWSCNFAIRRSTFDEVGRFDEAFKTPGFEDRDLCLRLALANARTVFVREATVCHPWRRVGTSEVLERYRYLELFLVRHPGEGDTLNSRRFRRGVGHCIKQLVHDWLPYRGRGSYYQLASAAGSARIAVRLWRRARDGQHLPADTPG